MDDQNFDEKSAHEWVNLIESKEANPRKEDIYPLISSWINKNNLSSILDIGAGQGDCLKNLALGDCGYIGIEPSPHLLARARQLYPKNQNQFLSGNAYHLPFKDSEFEGVFSIAVWHLLSDIKTANRELARVLTHDGKFLIITASAKSDEVWNQVTKNDEKIYLISNDEFKSKLVKANLIVTETIEVRVFTVLIGYKLGE